MASHESLIASALNISQSRINNYCRMVSPKFLDNLNRRKPRTMSELADIWYTSNGANYGRTQHYNDSRYHMLNLHATLQKERLNSDFSIRCTVQRKTKRLTRRTVKKLHSALPCTQSDGKNTKVSKSETTAD